MKTKKLIITLILLVVTLNVFSQASYRKDDFQINLGASVANYGIPVYLSFEYFSDNFFSFRADFNYRNYPYRNMGETTRIQAFCTAFGVSYHFSEHLPIVDNVDLYGGGDLGVVFFDYPHNYNGIYPKTRLSIGGHAGARYFFTNKFAGNVEVGGGSVFWEARVGLTFKL